MQKEKNEKQLLEEIFKNIDMGMQSINDITPKVKNTDLKKELARMYENYDKIATQARVLVDEEKLDIKTSHPFKKAMLWSSIQLNTMKDNSTNHILGILIQGCAMGYASLIDVAQTSTKKDGKIYKLAKELIEIEQNDEKRLTALLSATK